MSSLRARRGVKRLTACAVLVLVFVRVLSFVRVLWVLVVLLGSPNR